MKHPGWHKTRGCSSWPLACIQRDGVFHLHSECLTAAVSENIKQSKIWSENEHHICKFKLHEYGQPFVKYWTYRFNSFVYQYYVLIHIHLSFCPTEVVWSAGIWRGKCNITMNPPWKKPARCHCEGRRCAHVVVTFHYTLALMMTSFLSGDDTAH